MSGNQIFQDMKSQAEKDINEGRGEVVEKLKEIPVSELHHSDPTLFARITADQRADIFSHIAHQNEASAHRAPLNIVRYKKPGAFRTQQLWAALPLGIRSQCVGLFLSTALAAFMLTAFSYEDQIFSFISRPASLSSNSSYWPNCKRLTTWTDGCIYTVSSALSWQQAANILGLDIKASNRHLAKRKTPQRGDIMVVWRKQIPLEN